MRGETRSMTGTIPAFFRTIPVHNAFQMSTRSIKSMQPFFVIVHRYLVKTFTDDLSFTAYRHFLTGELKPIEILNRIAYSFIDVLAGSAKCDAGRIVYFFPFILPSRDHIGEQHGPQCAMGHPVTGITGNDENILIVHGVT